MLVKTDAGNLTSSFEHPSQPKDQEVIINTELNGRNAEICRLLKFLLTQDVNKNSPCFLSTGTCLHLPLTGCILFDIMNCVTEKCDFWIQIILLRHSLAHYLHFCTLSNCHTFVSNLRIWLLTYWLFLEESAIPMVAKILELRNIMQWKELKSNTVAQVFLH